MPQIREELTLVDNFSNTFNQFNTAADAAIYSAAAFKQSLDRFSEGFLDGFISSLEQAGSEIDEAANSTDEAARAARRAADEQRTVTHETEKSANAAADWVSKIKGAVAALGVAKAVKSFVETSDELVSTTARLDQMNDGLQTTEQLTNMIYNAAQSARGSFSDMASVVARFGNNAKDAFGSTAEVVAFAELVQKQMTIAGASTSEAANAMIQLSQGLGSGALRGDELNSIFEQAPNLIQSIADYLDVPIGQIRTMASEGQLTADIVKNAIFASAGDINTKFEQMPSTFGQVWRQFQNTALMAFTPVLQRFNELLNSQRFQIFFNSVCEGLYVLADVTMQVFDFMVNCGQAVIDNWDLISPVVYGVIAALAVYGTYLAIIKTMEIASAIASGAMAVGKGFLAAAVMLATGATWAETTAQLGLNSAMYACPIVWIIMLIIGLIAIIVLLCNWIAEVTGAAQSGIGIIVGTLFVAGAMIGNLFIAVINTIIDVGVVLWNAVAAFVNFFGNVFNDPIGAIARLFFDLVDGILALLETLAGAIDTLFGSNLAASVQGWRNDLGAWVDETFGKGEEIMAQVSGEEWHIQRLDYDEAWNNGVEFGDGVAEAIDNFSFDDIFGSGQDVPNPEDYEYGYTPGGSSIDDLANNVEDITKNTGNIADSMDVLMADEDLKMYRDIAEQRYMNNVELQTLAPNIHVEIPNGSNLSPSDVADAIKAMLIEQQASHTATAHA